MSAPAPPKPIVTREVPQPTQVQTLADEFAPSQLLSTLTVGLILGVVNSLLVVALMSLIFSGDLSAHLAAGIGVGLVGSAAMAVIIALKSGFAGTYAGVQDNSSAIVALSAAAIAASVVGPQVLDTVIAMMMAVSLATGAVFLLMARFHLGQMASFVPFPVVGGLLAGTGYLILVGSLDILGGLSLPDTWADTRAIGVLLPGLLLAGVLVAASVRGWSSAAYPGVLALGIVLFQIATRLFGISKQESMSRGWLIGPFPEDGQLPGLVFGSLADADWAAIGGEAASLATILILVPLTLLIYVSALEIGANTDLDVNAEIRSSGWANIVGGMLGAPPGYVYLSDTLVATRIVGQRRGPPVLAGLVLALVAFIGTPVLELIPQFVVGGLLLFYGVDFLIEWLWRARRRMSLLDYAITVGIVLTIATVGFLPGVAVGLAGAIILFVYRYSRVQVVKHLLTARECQSNIERPIEEAEYLRSVGDSVVILELQGFIFFGTASQIFERVKQLHGENPHVRFIVFGFRLVTGVDSSAVALFERIALFAQEHELVLLFAAMHRATREQFGAVFAKYPELLIEEPDVDHAVARSEEWLLEEWEMTEAESRGLPDTLAAALSPYLQPQLIPAGERLMTQGDPTPGIFLITSGRATVLLERPEAEDLRLRTLREGTVLGEIGLYRNEPCTATVMAENDCEVMQITPAAFNEMCKNDPGAAAEFHRFVVTILASRVSHANTTIRALRS